MSTRAHIVGGGLAGLSAGLRLAHAGLKVTLYEAGPAAGGRCRSYFDRSLGITIDNGNHLLLSGNQAAFAFLAETGGLRALDGPAQPIFPFMDVATGQRWTLRLSQGSLPLWIFRPGARVPETRPMDYLRLLRLARIRDERTIEAAIPDTVLYRRLIEPLAIAALNTPPAEASARLLGTVFRETLMRGGKACLPRFPSAGLSSALVDPAVTLLRKLGAEIRFGHRIAALERQGERIVGLRGADRVVQVGTSDAVLLAVPPWVASDLLPGLTVPEAYQAILNIHFVQKAARGEAGLIGIVGGTAEWVFVKQDHVSVTISAANRLTDLPAEAIAMRVWPDVRRALGLRSSEMPPWRVVKEKRATFAATPAQERRRPGARVPGLANLALAGDWTATGLPATIEGAIRSGRRAAETLLG